MVGAARTMTGIYDYVDMDEPYVKPMANVPHPTKDKTAGLVGEIPQRDHQKGYVSHRRYEGPERGFFVKGDGYAISNDILRKLMRYDVKFVYIAETDRKNVWEYNINSFIRGDEYNEGEPQHCAPLDTAIRQWENHADHLVKQ